MLLVRTAEAMALALESPLPDELKEILRGHVDRLAEYEDYTLEELAEFLIVEAGDALSDVETAYGRRLVADGEFTFTVELITEQGGFYEVTWIIDDTGFGLVLFVEIHPDTDARLLAACQHALATSNESSSAL
jgi:hypothetical protein